jgi:hypothetical protein
VPGCVLNAVRLMYAGAAYALLYGIGVIVAASTIIKNHPALATASRTGHTTVAGVAVLTVLLSLIEIALWLGIARACRKGKNWARITGTALFGLHTLGFLGVLINPHAGIGLAKPLTLVGWLIACAAVVFLWHRQSSAFFRAAGTPGR